MQPGHILSDDWHVGGACAAFIWMRDRWELSHIQMHAVNSSDCIKAEPEAQTYVCSVEIYCSQIKWYFKKLSIEQIALHLRDNLEDHCNFRRL